MRDRYWHVKEIGDAERTQYESDYHAI